jgi:microcystin degradation protein MlrC
VHATEASPDILTAGIAFGYPYADIPRVGMTVLVYARDIKTRAEACADELAAQAWDTREQFLITGNVAPSEAVRQAIAARQGPMILVDVADNIGGGTPGDGTVLLRELIAQRAQGAVVTIADAEAVRRAIDAGVRAQVELSVGGKQDDWHGAPVTVRGKVRLIADGRYVHRGTYMTGQTTDMGRTVVLDCDGIQVVLMERKAMPFDAQQLRSLAIEPAEQHIIVVKSAIAWKAAYGDLAREVIYTDTPGLCSSNLKNFEYRNISRPMFPLDPM